MRNENDGPSHYPTSWALHQRALRLIPGAHHLSGRPLLSAGESPLYFDRGEGGRIWDVDGNEYVDFLMAFGAFGLGYAHEEVDRAARSQASAGSLLSLNHPLHLKFVEAVLRRLPSAEMGIFVKTGSEATTAALRIARRATGRRRIARAGYHGWHDWCLPQHDEVPSGLGTQVLEYNPNQPSTLDTLFAEHPGEVAAVILAPEMVLPFQPATFHALHAAAKRNGAVFILDEIKTAFRTAPGSVQTRIGLQPELTTVSKALGNGWAVAAIVGKRSVMESAEGMHLSATYHGETSSMAAAMATMDIIDREDVCSHVWTLGETLIDGLNAMILRHGAPARAFGEPLPPMPFLKFTHPNSEVNDAARKAFFGETHARGLLLHPRHLWFLCNAHQVADIHRALEVCDLAFGVARARVPEAFDSGDAAG